MKKLFGFLLLFTLCTAPVFAQTHHNFVARTVYGIGGEFKRTFYTDFKEHPFSHGFTMALRIGAVAADTAVSCRGYAQGYEEVGGSRFLIGSHPNCRKAVLSSTLLMAVHEPAVNWLSHEFKNSCDREAADPNSRWNRTASHTKSTNGCYWGPQWADTIAIVVPESIIVKNNMDLLQQKH